MPKFGNWGGEDNTPYTIVFENARKNRGGKMINPNDPQENPDMFPNYASPSRPKTPSEESMGTNKRRVSREDGDFRANSPSRNEPVTHQRHGGGRGSNSGRPSRQSGGSDHSIAKSPLHPNSNVKTSVRVAASPVWEGKNNSYDSSHGTPGRSFESARATPGRHQMKQESPDRGTVVPKFGGWDDNDPQDAENYTEVFNKVREQRHVDSGNMPSAGGRTSYSTERHQQNEKQKCCCFPLW